MRIVQECQAISDWVCISVPSSDGVSEYAVFVTPWDRTEDEVVCTCPSYLNRGYCRHQVEALRRICSWAEDDSSIQQTVEQRKKHECPVCGGPTNLVVLNTPAD